MRLDEYNERRKEIIATKCGAVWNAFTELEGLINKTATTCPTISKVRRRGVDGILQPFAGYAKLKFNLGTSEFDDIGPQYAEFWTYHSSKERATDALVLIYERVLEQQKKKL